MPSRVAKMTRAGVLSSGAVVSALVVAWVMGASAGATEERNGPIASTGFCAPRVARDFLRPLAKMPPIHRVPDSGRLSFAPRGLTLEARGGSLVVGGGRVGFGFSDEAVGQIRHLDWVVSARLARVNSNGRVVAGLGSKRRRIGSIPGDAIKDLLFPVRRSPAFYRIDIRFQPAGSTRILGEFANYVRVLPPRFDARLLLSRPVAHPGEVISVRLANFGTETISSISPDWRFAVQHFNGNEWVLAPGNPPPQKQHAVVQKLPAGRIDKCLDFRVPTDEDAGRYRFKLVVERSLERAANRIVELTAGFEISGRSLK